jgi:Transglycosylase SLT domain
MRSLLGLVVLLATMLPIYLASRPAHERLLRDNPEPAAMSEVVATRVVDRLELDAHIQQVATRHGVSPRLVAAIIEAESEFNPRAVSRKGARGLMQLMPRTAASLRVGDLHDPFENVEGGVRHLRMLMDRYRGDLPRVLAAYNAGDAAVINYGGVPPYPETRRYVRRIMRQLEPNGAAAASLSAPRRQVGTAALRRAEVAAQRLALARPRGTAEVRRGDLAVEVEAPAASIATTPSRADTAVITNDSP